VRAQPSFADSLDLSVVAEGIESNDTRLILERLGCRLAQGYAFGRPLPASDLTATLLAALLGDRTSTAPVLAT
jgi:EAL domain-containing protein (putative c-di-GMP-specific phosphodiesterase class I)